MNEFTARDVLFLKLADAMFEPDLDEKPVELTASAFHILCSSLEAEARLVERMTWERDRATKQRNQSTWISLIFLLIGASGWLLAIAEWGA